MLPYKIVDLTHELTSNIPSWNEKCGFQHEIELDYKDCNTAVKFRVQSLEMSAGIGTHIDAPAHIIPGGKTIDKLPLQNLLAPCIVIDISVIAHENYSLSVQDILNFEEKHEQIPPQHFVMIKTGWEKFWQNRLKYRNNLKFPSVSKEAAELLLERKIIGLGIDTLSPDIPTSEFPVHALILGAGLYLVENAANLHLLKPTGDFILALPIKIAGGTEAPIRLIGLANK